MAKLIKGTVTAVDIETKTSKTGTTFNVIDVTVGNVKAGTFLRDVIKPREGDSVEMSYEPCESATGYKYTKLLGLKNLSLETEIELNLGESNDDN